MTKVKGKGAALCLAGALLAALSACAGDTVLLRSVSQEDPTPHAVRCEAIALPDTLRAPLTDGAVHTQLNGDVLSGAFTAVNSCRTHGFSTNGSATVAFQATVDDDAPPADARLALWQISGDGVAQYRETVAFACDGAAQAHTFTGLTPGARYRLVLSYTESATRRMTGMFTIAGVTGEMAEEDLGEAVLVGAAQDEPAQDTQNQGEENDD